jgi:mevalonate kinase
MESNSNPSKTITVSSPGKIHLIGEHSAVYGKPAILAAINLRFYASISKSVKKEILGITQYDNAIQNFQTNLESLISEKFKIKKIPNYKIEFRNEIPLGSGLGSSAAFCAIFSLALLEFLRIKWDLNLINELTFEGEKIFNGNPSGGDNNTVVHGGLILFRKETDSLKTFTTLPSNNLQNFLLIDSGKPSESTATMVQQVSLRAKRRNLDTQKILNDQESLAEEMVQVLNDGDEKKLMQIIKSAQSNLEKLGVVGKVAKGIIRKIESLKGAAKITGAGGIKKGSGMILAFHKDPNKLIKFAQNNNLRYYSTQISNEGVRIENE